jgi:predicted ATPase
VEGETVWPVPSLADVDAQALYLERAHAGGATLADDESTRSVIAEICGRLDGIPLAIELAAARARSMAPAEILGRLDARFRLLRGGPSRGLERHRTLHAAFQWSYGLLDEAEQRLFRQLSVFGGGCSAGQVMAVCANDDVAVMDEFDVVDVLDRLVARSLLVADRSGPTTRYRPLESLRQFGEDALQGAGESAVTRTRHATHFLALAEEARRRQSTPEAAGAAATLERDWDNFRAAVDWFTVTEDIDGALRLIIAIWWHAWFSLHYELAAWAHTAITLSGARHDPHWPADAGAAATLDWAAGDLEAAWPAARTVVRVRLASPGPRHSAWSFWVPPTGLRGVGQRASQ